MKTLADVFRVLSEMPRDGIVADYAVGGAMAMLFYAEPTRTYDLDVFVVLGNTGAPTPLISLDGIYAWARSRGRYSFFRHTMPWSKRPSSAPGI